MLEKLFGLSIALADGETAAAVTDAAAVGEKDVKPVAALIKTFLPLILQNRNKISRTPGKGNAE